ncbi:MAG: tetratricopeptide repeat protein [Methylophilaceae bacterium]
MQRIINAAIISMAMSTLAIASPIDDAKVLLQQGKAQESMEILESQLDQMANDVEFNYLLGISSLDAGKPGKAVFAFERVLALDPSHVQARAELGRAMIALGEFEAAEKELQQVRSAELPPEVSARLDSLLALSQRAMVEKAKGNDSAVSAYIETAIGYDSNINTATDATSVFIPAFGITSNLTGLATQQSSMLLGLNGSAFGIKTVSPGVDVFASLDARGRYHPSQSDFTTAGVSAGAGVRLTRGASQYTVGTTKYVYWINALKNDDQNSLYAQWQHELSRQDEIGLFGQYVRADHPIATSLNTNLYLLGGTWSHAFDRVGDPTSRLVVFAGDDRERSGIPSVGRHFYGVSISGDYKLRENIKLFATAATQYGRYGGQQPFFFVTREDWRHDLSAGILYQPAQAWTVTGQASYLRNSSNISIYDFDRGQALVTVRRDFF